MGPKNKLKAGSTGSAQILTATDLLKLKDFWSSVQLNEAVSGSILKLSREDVLEQVSGDARDLELAQFGLQCLENRAERGSLEWLVGKLPAETVVKGSGSESADALVDGAPAVSAAPAAALTALADSTICFLSKLPDGVFISGQTSKALGRNKIDFAKFNEQVRYNRIFCEARYPHSFC